MKEAGISAEERDTVMAFRLHMNRQSFWSKFFDILSKFPIVMHLTFDIQ